MTGARGTAIFLIAIIGVLAYLVFGCKKNAVMILHPQDTDIPPAKEPSGKVYIMPPLTVPSHNLWAPAPASIN